MDSESQSLSLGEAATNFLASLSTEERAASQQAVYHFVRWYGWERPLAVLTAPEVANYAERLSSSDTNYMKKLELIRAFLVYAKKEGWSKANLSTQLKPKKGKTVLKASSRRSVSPPVSLTQQGYDELKAELEELKSKRLEAIDEMRRAAADKDFRENAPLDAAREQRGQIEGRIEELEETLKTAVIRNDVNGKVQKDTLKIVTGDSVVLRDLASGNELCYTIVSPREVAPTKGKISTASPIGRAIVGRGKGEVVEVVAPAGKLRYQIEQVER